MNLREWANRTFLKPTAVEPEAVDDYGRPQRPAEADPNYFDPDSTQAAVDQAGMEYQLEQLDQAAAAEYRGDA